MTREELIDKRAKDLYEINKAHDEEYGCALESYIDSAVEEVDWFLFHGMVLESHSELNIKEELTKIIKCEIPECNNGMNCVHYGYITCVECQVNEILKLLESQFVEAKRPKNPCDECDLNLDIDKGLEHICHGVCLEQTKYQALNDYEVINGGILYRRLNV
jgi:hypothetical protein